MNRILLCLLTLVAFADCTTTGVICAEDEIRCGNTCANPLVNPAYCGAAGTCGVACATGLICDNGTCACPTGLTACGQACVDTRSNNTSCGACGNTCASNELCQAGSCVGSCGVGRSQCGTGCVDSTSDRQNCGGCTATGAGTACGQGTACVAGKCQATLVAACFGSGRLFSLDAEAEVVSPTVQRAPPTSPIGMAIYAADGGEQLEVADTGANTLQSFTLAGGLAAHDSDAIGQGATSVTIAGDRAYVINSTDHTLDILDLTKPAGSRRICPAATPACHASVDFGASTFPQYTAVTADSAFVTLQGDTTNTSTAGNTVARVKLADLSVKLWSPITQGLQSTGTMARPAGVAVSGSTLYVALGNLNGYVAQGPGLVAVYAIPGDASADAVPTQLVKLGDACLNAGPVLLSGSTLYVACGPKYDASFQASVPGALAALDLNALQPLFAPQPLQCNPLADDNCRAGGADTLALAAGKIFVGDSVDGRLFTVNSTTGAILRGPENPIVLCGSPTDGGPGDFISSVVAP